MNLCGCPAIALTSKGGVQSLLLSGYAVLPRLLLPDIWLRLDPSVSTGSKAFRSKALGLDLQVQGTNHRANSRVTVKVKCMDARKPLAI